MGFDVHPTYELTWPAGHRLHGLQVTVRSVPLGDFIDMMQADDAQSTAGVFEQQVTQLAPSLVRWNAEENGAAIPATAEGLRRLDKRIFVEVFDKWLDVLAGRDLGPLEESSTSGEPFPEGSIPMEIS